MKKIVPPGDAIRSSTGLTWLDQSGIIIAVGNAHDLHTLNDAIENHLVISQLSKGIKRPFLIDMSKVKSMSREARAFYAGDETAKVISAVAILTYSNIGKIVANFFLSLSKPTLPTKLFTDYDEAKHWLSQFANND